MTLKLLVLNKNTWNHAIEFKYVLIVKMQLS